MGFFKEFRDEWRRKHREHRERGDELRQKFREAFGISSLSKAAPRSALITQKKPIGSSETMLPVKSETPLVHAEVALYLQKQQDCYEMLTQYLAWQEEKERRELWLEGERERFAYDLQCRRIAMEKECRLYELQLQYDDLSYQQRGQIEQLKTEIERLKLELERRLY